VAAAGKEYKDEKKRQSSLPEEIRKAGDYVNRVRDQIEMLQYVRGRIGEDRDTILDICDRTPGHAGARAPTPVPAANPPLDQTEPRLEVELTTADNVMAAGTATSMQGPASGRDSPPFSPLSEGGEPGRSASKQSSEYSPVTDDDEHPEPKRLKQHENGITMTNSKSFTTLTPPIKEEAKTGDLFLANVTAKLTT
jgi:hypothetical protein